MANRGYLINSSSPTSDCEELRRLQEQPGLISAEVAESANRLLIPWFLCFRANDLHPVEFDSIQIRMPWTTVKQAVRNIEQSLPVFEALAGDPMLAQPYWKLACTCVRRLPLPYLTMDVFEILPELGEEMPDVSAHVEGALAGDLSAVPHLKFLSGYYDGVPYPLDVLYAVPGGYPDTARMWNASVLDGGFQSTITYPSWRNSEDAQEPAALTPLSNDLFGELYGVTELIEEIISAEARSKSSVGLGFSINTPELLEVNIYSSNPVEAGRLKNNRKLGKKLDEFARTRLQPWCAKYDIGWKGFDFSSPAWAQRTPATQMSKPTVLQRLVRYFGALRK